MLKNCLFTDINYQVVAEVVGQGWRPPVAGKPRMYNAVLKCCCLEVVQILLKVVVVRPEPERWLAAYSEGYSATQTALLACANNCSPG